jgi:hypothetical protein
MTWCHSSGGEVLRQFTNADACIVEEDVDASQALLDLVDNCSHLIGRGDVRGQDQRRDAGLLGQSLGGGVRFLGVACDDGDPGTGLGQAAGNAKADAAVPAGHQRRFSRQVEKTGHAAPPFG